MFGKVRAGLTLGATLFGAVLSTAAFADTINPTSFTADLAVGESVTLRKTVVVEAGSPTDATIDAYFLIDTSGSMGGVISAAKTAAGDIFSGIVSTFGSDVAGGVGVYSENAGLIGDTCSVGFPGYMCASTSSVIAAPGAVINQDVTTTTADVVTGINNVTLNEPDWGGDGPENVVDALKLVADNAAWRSGSNRFIFTFSDADGKGINYTSAEAIAALNAKGITLVSLSFGGTSHLNYMTSTFSGSVDFSGFTTATSASAIVSAVTAGITAGFDAYSTVTVDDLGGGGALIDVSTSCVSAAAGGACVGSDAIGAWDRSVDRTFEFDVTFTRTGAGDSAFATFALVDGGIVAREADRFPGASPVPLPAAGWLMLAGLGALAVGRRRRTS